MESCVGTAPKLKIQEKVGRHAATCRDSGASDLGGRKLPSCVTCMTYSSRRLELGWGRVAPSGMAGSGWAGKEEC